MKKRIPLESAAIEVANEASKPPRIFQLLPNQGRKVLEEAQNSPVCKYPAKITCMPFNTEGWGEIPVYFVSPKNIKDICNIIFYIHGAGWVLGSFHTHEKLVRELSARTNSLVVFPEYTRSPEAKFPVALEQCYSVLSSIPSIIFNLPQGNELIKSNLSVGGCPRVMQKTAGRVFPDLYPYINLDTLTVAGDSVGGNMATVMTMMAKCRGNVRIHKQLLYYPVTNHCFNTASYNEFATDYYLYRAGMMWFWQQYLECSCMGDDVYASPLRASREELCGLPQAMIITGEADVLRDEGEAYAKKLCCAGVDVTAIRIQGIIHDFVMLNSLNQTNACRAAMDVSTDWINGRNARRDNGCVWN